MAVDDVYQLQLRSVYAGQQLMNTLHFRTKTAADPTPATALLLADDWKNAFRTAQVTTFNYSSWLLQQVRGGTVSYTNRPCLRDGGIRIEGAFTGAVAGAVVGDGMPPQSAIVTTLSTGFSGRRRRGRLYLPGFQEQDQSAGQLIPGAVTFMQSLWATQMGKFGPGGSNATWQLGIWSMRTATGCAPRGVPPWGMINVDPPDPAAAYLDVTTATPKAIVYSQRRRTIGVGR